MFRFWPPGVGIWYYRSRKQPAIAPDPKKQPQVEEINVNDILDGKKPTVDETTKTSEPAVKLEVVDEDPYKQSQVYKNKGNKCFKEGKYADAIKFYQQAIDVCPKDKLHDVSTFHQNRAAAYEQLVTFIFIL